MSNDWSSRLVVAGPEQDVQAFAKAATDPATLQQRGRVPWEGERRLGLSFVALQRLLPRGRQNRLRPEPEDPWGMCVEPLKALGPGFAQRTYKFQARWESDHLLAELSTELPRLCFVLASVDPATDTQESLFIHRGHLQRWKLPASLRARFTRRIPDDAAEDLVLQADFEADWAMMGAVVGHWDRKLAATLRRLRPRRPARRSPVAARRKRGK